MSSLSQAIIKTVTYFDIFDYPLSVFEIWQYLPETASLNEVTKALETNTLSLEKKDGFVFLPGRAELITIRRQRYLEADTKIKKAKRRLALIQWLPGIQLICLANIIGSHNLRASSDTDLFIITKTNRLWLVKFCATIILKIFGLRPTATKNKDQLCLSFLVDDSALDLSLCQVEDDYYFTYWLTGLLPLYGSSETFKKLIEANSWLHNKLPNWQSSNNQPRYYFQEQQKNTTTFEIFNILEKSSKKFQEHIMSPALQKLANQSKQVIINDHILKLHTVDRRDYFKTEYLKRLEQSKLTF
jgi:hypothetical protein